MAELKEYIELVENQATHEIIVVLEPWGMPVPLPSKKTMKLVMRASAPGILERVIEEDSIVVYAWPSSDIYATIDDIMVHDSRGNHVPGIPSGMTTHGFLNLTIGPELQKAAIRRRPWWKFW